MFWSAGRDPALEDWLASIAAKPPAPPVTLAQANDALTRRLDEPTRGAPIKARAAPPSSIREAPGTSSQFPRLATQETFRVMLRVEP